MPAAENLPLDYEGPTSWPFEPFPMSAIERSVTERFRDIAARFAGNLAVSDETRQYTYAELAHMADRITTATVAAAAGRPGPIAILLENEARYPAAMLGIVAAGRGYVALDANHPADRNRIIAHHARVAAVVSAGTAAERARRLFDGIPVLDLQALPDATGPARDLSGPDDLAWIIYTSGSTGAPKGVFQNQRGLLHDIMQATNSLHLSSEDRQFLSASPSLLSGTRIAFGSLLNGGSIHCFSPQRLLSHAFADEVSARGITVFRSVPAVFRHAVATLGAKGRLDSLRLVLLGGDRVDWNDYDAFCRACGDDAVFGTHLSSTECSTIYLQWFLGKGAAHGSERLPVGRAVAERPVALIGDDGRPIADGEVGEFVVASRYLALGYWREPASDKFGVDPSDPAKRTFRTGDLGRRRLDGLFEFHGRKDRQIKIRGYRIEPGEIERALSNCPSVRDGAVVVRRDAAGVAHAIVAYAELQPGTRGLLPRHIRAMLAQRLPQHMVPAIVTVLDGLPRLPNLKIDRVSLATMDAVRLSAPGQDDLIRNVAGVFDLVLGIEGATADDTVLSLGGDSFKALDLGFALEQRFSIRIPDEVLSAAPTVREIAQRIATIDRPVGAA